MKTIECSVAQLRPELNQQITAQFCGNEDPLACCEANADELFQGKPSLAYVITQRQIIEAWSFRDTIHNYGSSMFLSDVVTIDEREGRGKDVVQVTLSGHGDTHKILYLERGHKFISALRAAIGQAKTTASQMQISAGNRLQELTQLRNERLISDAEFEQKRKEILNQL